MWRESKEQKFIKEATDFLSRIKGLFKNPNSIAAIEFIIEKSFLKNLSELNIILNEFINELGRFIEKVKLLIDKVKRENQYLFNDIKSSKSQITITNRGELAYRVKKFISEFEQKLNLVENETLNSKQRNAVKEYCKLHGLNEDSFLAKLRKFADLKKSGTSDYNQEISFF